MESGVSSASLDLGHGERLMSLRRPLGVTTIGINQMLLHPGQRTRIHTHAHQEEVYIVLEGTLTLLVEGEEQTHGPRELVRVAPDVRRQLLNKGSEDLVMVALGGANEHNGRDATAYDEWDGEGKSPADVPWPDDLPT